MTEADLIITEEQFLGRKAIIIPDSLVSSHSLKDKVVASLMITGIGNYPNARLHIREHPHGIDQHTIIYCIEGKGLVKVANQEFTINAGEFFLVPALEAHKYAADDTDPWTIYWVNFKGDVANNIVASFQQQFNGYKGAVNYDENRIRLFNSIYSQLEKGYSADNIAFANMSFWYFLTSFLYEDKYNNNDRVSKQDITGKSINFMAKNIEQVISVEDIAGSVNLSVSHFTALFKKKTGFSPIEYYNHLKIQKACQYLLFTDLRVKEISFKLGISDPYYFSRLFTKVIGLSPNEYREEKKIH